MATPPELYECVLVLGDHSGPHMAVLKSGGDEIRIISPPSKLVKFELGKKYVITAEPAVDRLSESLH